MINEISRERFPLTAASLARFFHIKGCEVDRYYSIISTTFEIWLQKEHATGWIMLADNLDACCNIEETNLCNAVHTFVSNKAGHEKKASVIPLLKGKRPDSVSSLEENL
ncbi:transposase family protein [gut metagenome]|uniref:Transposase family protein n=1 Tax=gut metagenome TaxID=749906 RepID=J9GT53_9ZZZZ